MKGNQKITIAAAGVALLGLIAFTISWSGNREPLLEREIATRVMGEFLRKEVNPHAVVIAGNPYTQKSGGAAQIYAFEKAGEKGLRKGLGEDVQVNVDFPKLKNPSSVYFDPHSTTPLSFIVVENGFDELVRAHPGADLIVSLIGIPIDALSEDCWNKPGVRLAFLLPDFRVIGDPEIVRGAFKSGKIAAVVVPRAGAVPNNEAVRGKYKAEFEKRFLLVTRENIDAVLPRLFH